MTTKLINQITVNNYSIEVYLTENNIKNKHYIEYYTVRVRSNQVCLRQYSREFVYNSRMNDYIKHLEKELK